MARVCIEVLRVGGLTGNYSPAFGVFVIEYNAKAVNITPNKNRDIDIFRLEGTLFARVVDYERRPVGFPPTAERVVVKDVIHTTNTFRRFNIPVPWGSGILYYLQVLYALKKITHEQYDEQYDYNVQTIEAKARQDRAWDERVEFDATIDEIPGLILNKTQMSKVEKYFLSVSEGSTAPGRSLKK